MAFYVALPLLLWVIGGRLWRAAALAALTALGVQILARYDMLHDGWHYVPQYTQPLVQAPVFLSGITAALAALRFRLPHVPGLALALLAVIVVVLPNDHISGWRLQSHLPFAALSCIAVALIAARPPRLIASAFMRRLGEVSYSMYLIHFALLSTSLRIAEWIAPASDWRTLMVHFVLTATASFGLACLTNRWIEQPCIRAMARWLRRETPQSHGAFV